jgi:23S rRNA pseudouridine1911/1915/1917 synthase
MATHTLVINRRQAGQVLVDILRSQLRLPHAEVVRCVRERGVRLAGNVCTDPNRRVRSGQRVHVTYNPLSKARQRPGLAKAPKKPEAPEKPEKPAKQPPAHGVVVRYVDEAIAVVEKPAGLTTVRHADEAEAFGRRAQRFLPPTLTDVLPPILRSRGMLQQGRVRAVHRLDKETSGLVVFALMPTAERELGKQFRAHSIERRYLALVRGQAQEARIESNLVRDRGDGRRGSGAGRDGQHAVTQMRVVEQLGDFALVECVLETGRTHQVRIHLGEAGTPLCGERLYDRPRNGKPMPDGSGARRPMLHAAYLAVNHPSSRRRMEWEAPMPEDMRALLQRLRAKGA